MHILTRKHAHIRAGVVWRCGVAVLNGAAHRRECKVTLLFVTVTQPFGFGVFDVLCFFRKQSDYGVFGCNVADRVWLCRSGKRTYSELTAYVFGPRIATFVEAVLVVISRLLFF